MTTIIRDYEEGQLISDVHSDEKYTFDELDGARFLESSDITGEETYQLTNGKIAVIQSIDLDWVSPINDWCLRTTSLSTPAHYLKYP
jgi:hypothetical protein